MRIISMQKGGDAKEVFNRLASGNASCSLFYLMLEQVLLLLRSRSRLPVTSSLTTTTLATSTGKPLLPIST